MYELQDVEEFCETHIFWTQYSQFHSRVHKSYRYLLNIKSAKLSSRNGEGYVASTSHEVLLAIGGHCREEELFFFFSVAIVLGFQCV